MNTGHFFAQFCFWQAVNKALHIMPYNAKKG